jgi:hypothetical protein
VTNDVNSFLASCGGIDAQVDALLAVRGRLEDL